MDSSMVNYSCVTAVSRMHPEEGVQIGKDPWLTL